MQSNTDFVLTLLSTAARVERRLDGALSMGRGVSFTEYNLLKQLQVKHGGAATRVALASAVGLTPSAVTRALKPLEKIGLVVTEKSERDARKSLATLTKAGEELLSDADTILQDHIDSLTLPSEVDVSVIDALNRIVS